MDIGDILEEFKIRTFIDITRPHKTIGIPYFAGTSNSETVHAMTLSVSASLPTMTLADMLYPIKGY